MSHPAQRLIADSYDRAAKSFAEHADQHVYGALAVPLVDAVRSACPEDTADVLDVAAGSGAIGRLIPRCIAVDLSLGQLRHNRTARRVQADGIHLPFRDGSFDAAVCGFGINHVSAPGSLVRELARVAPVVAVSTWARPEAPHAPRQVVFDVLARQSGQVRSPAGAIIDRFTDAVGTPDAVEGLLRGAHLQPDVRVVQVHIPWPGIETYLAYRLSMPTSAPVALDPAGRTELHDRLAALPPESLPWRARIIVGVGS
jgi:SAM-dependent methyltransferase